MLRMSCKLVLICFAALVYIQARPTDEGVEDAEIEIEGDPVPVRPVKDIQEELVRLNVTLQEEEGGSSCLVNITEQENERKPILLGRNAITKDRYLWKGNFPVHLDPKYKFSEEERKLIEVQLSILQEQVFYGNCLNITLFPPGKRPTGVRDYVNVQKLQGCSSESIGRRGGPQSLSLIEACHDRFGKTVIHEFMHALGLAHEQNRPDRDDYVIINWENIEHGESHNFIKVDTRLFGTYGVEYNYNSIMHYYGGTFSKNGKKTIVAKDNPRKYVGADYRGIVPDTDKLKLRRMYKCDPK